MKKVTYLIGAGASFGTLPLTETLPNGLRAFANEFLPKKKGKGPNSRKAIGYKREKKLIRWEGEDLSRGHCYDMMNEEINWLANEVESVANFDTLSKRFTIKGETENLAKSHSLLSLYFTYLQTILNVSPRHDSFFASILDIKGNLPENIKVLSWNYDNQFEEAFAAYVKDGENNFSETSKKLGLKHSGFSKFKWQKGFELFKLNGSASFVGEGKTAANAVFEPLDPEKEEGEFLLDKFVTVYFKATKKGLKNNIRFAWDNSVDNEFFTGIKNAIKDTEILVVIGYSMPYFNREIDKFLLESMEKLEHIFVQDPNYGDIIENIRAYRSDLQSFYAVNNLNQFYLPHVL